MISFLTKKRQTEELFRIWNSTLLVEEALQQTLVPVRNVAAQLEGRGYFKSFLPTDNHSDFSKFLFRQTEEFFIKVSEEQLPFLLNLSKKDILSRRYRQRIEHNFLVGFPTFFYRDRFGTDRLTTLFKFPLLDVEYPEFSERSVESYQPSLLEHENRITLFQEVSGESESISAYWLDELFLEEELGISDEEILKFRKECYHEGFSPIEFLTLFCERLLGFEGRTDETLEENDAFCVLIAALTKRLSDSSTFSLNRVPTRIYPYSLVYELEMNQPTRQLQRDIADIINRDLLKHIKTEKTPARYYLFGGNGEKQFSETILGQCQPKELTKSQEKVIKAVENRSFTVVNGPPGTGKTHVIRNVMANRLVAFAAFLDSPDKRMMDMIWSTLVTSTNNRAVDNALEGLEVEGALPVCLRIGSRIVLSNHTSDFLSSYLNRLSGKVEHKSIKEFYKYKDDLKRILETIPPLSSESRDRNSTNQDERRYLAYLTARKVLDSWVGCNKTRLEKVIRSIISDIKGKRGLSVLKKTGEFAILATAFPLFGSTLLSLKNFFPMEKEVLGCVIVDEAGQCSTSYILPALLRAKKALVIGDTKQLEPIANLRMDDIDQLRKQRDIGLTRRICRFFSSSSDNPRSAHHIANEACENVLELTDHFRCKEEIIQVCVDLCDYKLNVLTELSDTELGQWPELQYLNVEGKEKRYGASWVNEKEVMKIGEIVRAIESYGVPFSDIAILTPFKGQLNYINHSLRKDRVPVKGAFHLSSLSDGLTTGTVHRFQGGERRIVLFSHVISEGIPVFLNSRVNLLNVAMSRAQSHFIFVGSMDALSRGCYTALLREHLLEKGEPIHI